MDKDGGLTGSRDNDKMPVLCHWQNEQITARHMR